MEAAINKILNFSYTPELSESEDEIISGIEILEMAKGNIKYCLLIMERLEWQHPQTIIQEDLQYGEIIEVNNQFVLQTI